MKRVQRLVGHLDSAENPVAAARIDALNTAGESPSGGSNDEPLALRWNGWGFKDTQFELNHRGQVALTGNRYLFSGHTLPNCRSFMETKAGLDITKTTPSQDPPKVPPSILNDKFLKAIDGRFKSISFSDEQRLFHAHGHTCQEVFKLRFGSFERVPDVVIWPASHQHVEALVKAANEHNVVIIPFGGGTSVSQALLCPVEEKRMIVSLDMHQMNSIKWVNKQNMTACMEAGIVGKDIEKKLAPYGVVMGHEPDSAEFSTLGGWIATRASGMRKNVYGNIEDIVIKIKMVTSTGTLVRSVSVSRMSCGPDLHELILGSEGTLGVITEAVVRLRPAPEITRYGSMIFPDFESGVACLHEVAMKRAQPASIRLVDNTQFQFSQVLKPPHDSWKEEVSSKAKKWYVTKHLKFDPDTMVAVTLLFEGSKAEVDAQEKKVYSIAAKYGGMKAGEENGIRGYFLTYMIAYLRDFGINYSFIAESFETSVPWENVLVVCREVKNVISSECQKRGCPTAPFMSARVTQLYDTGACIYFYFGFIWHGLKDPVATFSAVEHAAREEILKHGGSISHHHGVGKLRKDWVTQTISPVGVNVLKALKRELDPNDIFAARNIIP